MNRIADNMQTTFKKLQYLHNELVKIDNSLPSKYDMDSERLRDAELSIQEFINLNN